MKPQFTYWSGSTKIRFANIDEAKRFVMHLRALAEKAAMDMDGNLSDLCFAVETDYQKFYDLDPDDFDILPF